MLESKLKSEIRRIFQVLEPGWKELDVLLFGINKMSTHIILRSRISEVLFLETFKRLRDLGSKQTHTKMGLKVEYYVTFRICTFH